MYITIDLDTEKGKHTHTHTTKSLWMSFGNRQTAFPFDADYYFLSANLATIPQHKQTE